MNWKLRLVHQTGKATHEPEVEAGTASQTDLTVDDLTNMFEDLTIIKSKHEILERRFRIVDLLLEGFACDDRKTKYFTGLSTYKMVFLIHETIASHLYIRSNVILSTFQQLILTLMKLRLNLSYKFLSYRYCSYSNKWIK